MVILLIIDNRNSIAKDLDCVEWTTLLFLSCVFIIIRGIVETGLIRLVASACVFYVEWGVTPVVTSLGNSGLVSDVWIQIIRVWGVNTVSLF